MLSAFAARLVYGASLLGLLCNDWVLKRSGDWPVVSGKLSDFAGLVVAPVTLCLLARHLAPEVWARARLGGRWVVFGATAFVFAAINLSPVASDLFVRALALWGVHWRLWSDPSDSIALVVLPLGWLVVQALEVESLPRRVVGRVGELAVACAGAFACIASGGPDPRDTGVGFIVNATGMPLQLRTSRLQGERDCGTERVLFEDDVLRADDFGRPATVPFEVGAAFHLFPWRSGHYRDGEGDAPCNPVRIAVWPEDGDESEAVSGVVEAEDGEPRRLGERPTTDELRDARRLVQVVSGDAGLELRVGPELRALRLAEGEAAEPPDACRLRPSPRASIREGAGVVASIEPIGSRCYDITLRADDSPAQGTGGTGGGGDIGNEVDGGEGGSSGAAAWQPPEPDHSTRFSLCVDVHVPFQVGEALTITSSSPWRGEATTISSNTTRITLATSPLYEVLTPETCPQVRHSCGAIWLTEEASISTPLVAAQGRDLLPDANGIHIVNTYRVLLGREECPAHLLTPARRAEWVEARY